MKPILNTLLVLIALAVISVGVVYFIYPGVLLNAVQSMAANNAGVEHRSVDIESYQAHYYEGGSSNQTTLVLLHGLGDDKNSFVTSIRELTQEYRVILPDLQAHGDNALIQGRDYSIAGQAKFIEALLRKLNANRVIVGGHSMGGHIALSFAARYSEKTNGLILVNAAGMPATQSPFYQAFPDTVDRTYFNDKFARLYVTPPAFPKPVVQHMANKLNPKIPFLNVFIRQLNTGEDARIDEISKTIQTNSLIIWGQQDPLLPVTIAERLQQNLVNSTLLLLENAGHSPHFETPDQVQSAIKDYLNKQN